MVKTPEGRLLPEAEARKLGYLADAAPAHLADVEALGTVPRVLAHLGVPQAAHIPELAERVGDILRMNPDRVTAALGDILARPELRGAAERCALTPHTLAPFLAGFILAHV